MQKNNIKITKKSIILGIFFAFLIILFNFFLNINSRIFAEEEIFSEKIDYDSSAKSAVMIESSTKRILYEKNIEQKLPMASTTKIVTAITVIENCDDLDKTIIVDNRCVGTSGTSIYLKPGEELTIRELLYGLMLRSGNDASVALAYAVAGGIDEFCNLMNDLAKKVGAINSCFLNPHGLDQEGHYTTAYDLALITSYALENDDFAEIVKTKNIRICEGKDNTRYLINKNKLLTKLDGCIGVKTGFTDDAGRCLVSACERDNLKLVCVVFNCGPMFEESQEMFELAYKKFEMIEILPTYYFVGNIEVKNGEIDECGLYTKNNFRIPLSVREKANINVIFDIPECLTGPIEKDEEVGNCEIYFDNHLIFSEKIYTIEEVNSKLYKDKIKQILDNWNA